MMRSALAVARAMGVLLLRLVVWSHRLCHRGKTTPAATKLPRATRAPTPFVGLTCKPTCPVCEHQAASSPQRPRPPLCSAITPSLLLWTIAFAARIIVMDYNLAAEGHLSHD